MIAMILVLGFVFGLILQYANLNKFNVISGLATLENLAVVKTIALAIGIGAILLSLTIGFGFASFHVKPFISGGIVLGGLIFGVGMAILGYCPGTLFISLGEGSLDALTGIIGGLVGGLIFTLLLPDLGGILGPDLGTISLSSLMGSGALFYILTFAAGAFFIAISFWLNKKDNTKDI
ncbi:MAG: YeeE/YedE family protein, partial [Saprospiraceae bacterium]|nr:YeeE/YedE family protein [Saprospiraceae bacterium]